MNHYYDSMHANGASMFFIVLFLYFFFNKLNYFFYTFAILFIFSTMSMMTKSNVIKTICNSVVTNNLQNYPLFFLNKHLSLDITDFININKVPANYKVISMFSQFGSSLNIKLKSTMNGKKIKSDYF